MHPSTKQMTILALGAGVLVALAVALGVYVGYQLAAGSASGAQAAGQDVVFPAELQQRLLHADSASIGKQIAVATGNVADGTDGVFVLDFLTGDLYCWTLNPRNVGAGYVLVYKTNVLKDLGIEKGKTPDYVLVTGDISATRGSAVAQPAGCVCYVADGSTGAVAAYSLLYNPTMFKAGRPQLGNLVTLAKAKARPDIERAQ